MLIVFTKERLLPDGGLWLFYKVFQLKELLIIDKNVVNITIEQQTMNKDISGSIKTFVLKTKL